MKLLPLKHSRPNHFYKIAVILTYFMRCVQCIGHHSFIKQTYFTQTVSQTGETSASLVIRCEKSEKGSSSQLISFISSLFTHQDIVFTSWSKIYNNYIADAEHLTLLDMIKVPVSYAISCMFQLLKTMKEHFYS